MLLTTIDHVDFQADHAAELVANVPDELHQVAPSEHTRSEEAEGAVAQD